LHREEALEKTRGWGGTSGGVGRDPNLERRPGRGTPRQKSASTGATVCGEPAPAKYLHDAYFFWDDQTLTVWRAGGGPILAQDLHQAVFGWQGETVRVAGYYQGSTYSSANDTTSQPTWDQVVLTDCRWGAAS
jgi:hypothetical protein